MSTKYTVFDEGGLHALLKQTKANKNTAADNSAAVEGLTSDFESMTGQLTQVLGEVETCLTELDATKADVTAVNNSLATKVDKVDGKGLSTNDFTTEEKKKLASITSGANAYTLPAAGSSLGGVKSGGDVTISNGVITVNDDSHNHTIANVDGLQSALDGKETSGAAATALTNAKAYTDTKISSLINSAPTTLDTLGEIATAMEENAEVVDALESAIGAKANTSDLAAVATSGKYSDLSGKPTIPTKTSQLTNDSGFKTTDNNTTYSLSKSGSTITLTGSDGTTTSVTDADTNTTYSAAGSSLGLVKSGGDVTISSGVITVNDDSHNHTIANVDGLQDELDGKSDTGHTHTAATTSAAGFMSASDKTKLNGIATGAEVNQNAFANVTVGSTTISADAKSDTLTLVAGSNVTLTPDATNDKVTIAAKDTVYTHPTTSGNKHIPSGGSSGQILRWSADGTAAWGADNNTTYSAATQSAQGLMSAADKTKLDGIATGANAYTHPSYTARTGVPTANQTPAFGGTFSVSQPVSDATGHITAINSRTITIPSTVATTSAAGLMSASDKSKLNAITESADSVSFSASATSGNKVGTITINGTATNMYSPTQTSVSGNAGTATKLANARTIALGTGATGTATSFDGSANITIPVTSVKEAYLSWGGQNIAGSFSALDAALIEDLSANRLAGIASSKVVCERSSNAGSTWTTYTPSGGTSAICTTSGNACNSNTTSSQSVNNWHRITIDVNGSIYCELRKIAIYLSTAGAGGAKCKVEWGDYSSTTVWTTATETAVSGWSGWNIINVNQTIGSSSYGKVRYVRLTFSQTSLTSAHASNVQVFKVRFYSNNCWNNPSTLASTGHLYSYDSSLNATFPAGVTATTFTGALSGNASTATKATKDASGNTITSTYETKTDATAKINALSARITALENALAALNVGFVATESDM